MAPTTRVGRGARRGGEEASKLALLEEPLPIPFCSTTVRDAILAARRHLTEQQFTTASSLYKQAQASWIEETGQLPAEVTLFFHLARGRVFDAAGKPAKALTWYTKAFQSAQCLPPGHPDLALVYSSVARIYARNNNMNAALDHYRKAFNIRCDLLGLEHPDCSILCNNIAVCLWQLENFETASSLLQEAATSIVACLGSAHERTTLILANVTRLHAQHPADRSAGHRHVRRRFGQVRQTSKQALYANPTTADAAILADREHGQRKAHRTTPEPVAQTQFCRAGVVSPYKTRSSANGVVLRRTKGGSKKRSKRSISKSKHPGVGE